MSTGITKTCNLSNCTDATDTTFFICPIYLYFLHNLYKRFSRINNKTFSICLPEYTFIYFISLYSLTWRIMMYKKCEWSIMNKWKRKTSCNRSLLEYDTNGNLVNIIVSFFDRFYMKPSRPIEYGRMHYALCK